MNRIFLTAMLMAAFIFGASSSDANAQIKKSKEVEEELQSLRDSLEALRAQLVSLEEENLRYRTELSEEEDTTCNQITDINLEDYTVEVTDSLIDLWYTHQMAALETKDETYDINTVQFSSNVADEVYIERLKKMNSFIQIPYNEIVRKYIIMYSEKMPRSMPHILGLCNYYMPIFEEIFDSYDLPVELTAMTIIESHMNPRAESRVGAKGMWQFMYKTAKGYGLHIDSFVDERMDPVKSCNAAARYLRDVYKIFGDWNLAIASYNCGAGNVLKAIKRAGGSRQFWDIWPYLPAETRNYTPAFVGALYTLEYYKEHGLKPESMVMPTGVDTLEIKKQLHLKQVSEITGAPHEELKNLNPQYKHEIIPGHERTYILRIPHQYTMDFIEREDTIYKHKSNVFFDSATIKQIQAAGDGVKIVYTVKSGDSLGAIAKKHNVTVAKIKEWNKLKSDSIKIGQKLIIYRGGKAPATSSSSKPSTSSSSTSKQTKITYTVKSGDALGKIAATHGVSVAKLKEWNNLKSDNIIVGQKLTIYTNGGPAKSSSSSSSSSYTTYTVKSGDSFYSIAKNYPGVSAQNIMDYNGLTSSKLRPGMTLKIPQY